MRIPLMLALGAALFFLAAPLSAVAEELTAEEVFQEARYLETASGDLVRAIERYRVLVKEYPAETDLAHRARFRIGFCQELLGQDEEALRTYRAVAGALHRGDALALEVRRRQDRVEERLLKQRKEAEVARLVEEVPTAGRKARLELAQQLVTDADPDYLPVLAVLLDDPAEEVRLVAVDALAALGTERVLPYLYRTALDASPSVRYRAIEVVAAIEEQVQSQIVSPSMDPFEGLASRNLPRRYEALHRLQQMPAEEVLPRLVHGVTDEDPLVRHYVVILLGNLEVAEAIAPLKEALIDPYALIRLNAAWGLYKLGDRSGRPVLQAALDHDDRSIRRQAAGYLSHFGDRSASPLLLAGLKDPDPYQREQAVQGLRRLFGVEMGFEPRGSEEERARAIAAWEAYLAARPLE